MDDNPTCRLCLTSKHVPQAEDPHNFSECADLPENPMKRYETLAKRLVNIRTFQQWVNEGRHPPIITPHGTIGLQSQGLRGLPQAPRGNTSQILRHTTNAAAQPKN